MYMEVPTTFLAQKASDFVGEPPGKRLPLDLLADIYRQILVEGFVAVHVPFLAYDEELRGEVEWHQRLCAARMLEVNAHVDLDRKVVTFVRFYP